jgi:hypothetical protein
MDDNYRDTLETFWMLLQYFQVKDSI